MAGEVKCLKIKTYFCILNDGAKSIRDSSALCVYSVFWCHEKETTICIQSNLSI